MSRETAWARCSPVGIFDRETAREAGFEMAPAGANEEGGKRRRTAKAKGAPELYSSHGHEAKPLAGGLARGMGRDLSSPLPSRIGSVSPQTQTDFPLAGCWCVSEATTIYVLAADERMVCFQNAGSGNSAAQQMDMHRFGQYLRSHGFNVFKFDEGVIWQMERIGVVPEHYEAWKASQISPK